MKDEKKERFPSYVPLPYRLYVQLRKVSRQAAVRQAEKAAAIQPPSGITPDGPFSATLDLPKDDVRWINKNSFHTTDSDLEKPEIKKVAGEIEALKALLKERGLAFTNTAATFLPRMFYPRSEKTKLWENAWTVYHSGVKKGETVLDIGGASTPFSFYLASLGCHVKVLDNDWGNCGTLYNANYVAKKMGWDLEALDRDIAVRFPFADNTFDRVFSICTIEHLPSPVRQFMMREVSRVLKPGGIAAITMCYDRGHKVLTVDKGLRPGYRQKFEADLIKASGLEVYGNKEIGDWNENEDFLGAVFFKKAV